MSRRDRPAGFRGRLSHRHMILTGLPQCCGHGCPEYADDSADDLNGENEHHHWGSPPPALAALADRRRLQRMGKRLAVSSFTGTDRLDVFAGCETFRCASAHHRRLEAAGAGSPEQAERSRETRLGTDGGPDRDCWVPLTATAAGSVSRHRRRGAGRKKPRRCANQVDRIRTGGESIGMGNVIERSGRIFVALRKDGGQRLNGRRSVYHAVTPNCRIALCAAEPGSSSRWAEPPASQITCPVCLVRLKNL